MEFVLQLPDHAFVAGANGSGALSGHLPVHFGKSLPKAFYLSRRAFPLSIALDHDSDLTI